MEGREAEEAFGAALAGTGVGAVVAEDAADVCGICQDHVQEWGKLSSCIHRFCVECIMEWAGVESTCPLCRARFSTVTHMRLLPSGQEEVVAVKKVKWRTQIHRPDSDEDEAAIQDAMGELVNGAGDFCIICDDNGDEECLLLCDGCDVACHTYCCGLDSVPEGSWYCGICRESMTNTVTRPSRSSNARSNSSTRGRSTAAAPATSSAGGSESTRSSSILQSARRAARTSARNAARGRRSAMSRSAGRSSATVAPSRPPPQPTVAPVLTHGSTTQELLADASLMRSNWSLFQSRGFSPSVPPSRSSSAAPLQRPSSEGNGDPGASASSREDPAAAAKQSWQMAEEALRSIQMQQQTGRGSRQQQPQGSAAPQNNRQASSRERSAALDQVRSLILSRRGVTGNRRGSTSSAAERRGGRARGGGAADQQLRRLGDSETALSRHQQQRWPWSPPRSPTGPPPSIMGGPSPSSVPLGGLGRLAASPMRREPKKISVSGLQLAGARAASQRPSAPPATPVPAHGGARHPRQQQSSTASDGGAPPRPESAGPVPEGSSALLRPSSTATTESFTSAAAISAEISSPGHGGGLAGTVELPPVNRATSTETQPLPAAPEGEGRGGGSRGQRGGGRGGSGGGAQGGGRGGRGAGGGREGGDSRKRREEIEDAPPPQAGEGGRNCSRPHKRRRHSKAADDDSPASTAAAQRRSTSRNGTVAAGSNKQAAFEAVKVELNPLYRSRELSREDYKAVAQAATRILVAESRLECGGSTADRGGGAADEAWLKPEVVRAAVQRAREGVLCPDG